MLRLVVLAMVVVVVVGLSPPYRPKPAPGCSYYCIKPEGPNKGASYCCSPPHVPLLPEQKHPGRCPPPLKECTRGFIPKICPHDGHCPYGQKCCFDTCLDLHTCKPAY
ncbi:hypothetical protein OTU49_006928 [Cherax quadricarinatus]|uniref:WAP domain-containing protein n=1 Tax=Cherax quadricarinatus TaxID=27406 RepID=A0AAW0WZB6_CHEQU